MTHKHTIMLLTLFILGSLLLPTSLRAQSAPIGLSITPAVSIAPINENGATRMAYTFRNDSTIDLQVTPAIHPFHIDPVSHDVVVDTDQTVPFATTENMDLHFNEAFTLPAGESKQIVVLVTPPAKIARDVMLTLTGTTMPELSTSLSGSTNTTSMVIGAHLFLTTKHAPTLTTPLHLESVTIPTILDTFSSIHMKATVVNDEQTLHQIKGTLRLQGPFKDDLLPFSQEFVAANSSRDLVLQDQGSKAQRAIDLHGPFFPGKYTITTTLLEDGGTPKHDIFVIYVVPLKATGALLISLLLFGLVYQMKRKKGTITS